MSSITASSFISVPPPLVLQPRRWTCDEFHQMGAMGWFEGRRAMLIEGEILEIPGPKPPHATMTAKVDYALRRFFGEGYVIRNQSPLVLGQSTDPEPDLAVVVGDLMDYFTSHPTTAALVIEVADSTLLFDTNQKASLYAAAGIADYWVVDLLERRVIVFRDPQVDAKQLFGAKYAAILPLKAPATIVPLCDSRITIAVEDLLP